ncbi:hypothetical protein LTR66_017208, partial [Elasticomyces elasticus]
MDSHRGEKRKRPDYDHCYSERYSDRPWIEQPQDGPRDWARSEQARLNHMQEEDRHREFMAQEDNFIVQQKRKAAQIRVREGRAKPIDWLVVNLQHISPIEDLINEGLAGDEIEYADPVDIIEDLPIDELRHVRKEINDFLDLESRGRCTEYWRLVRT